MSTVSVQFLCQACNKALLIDETLYDLSLDDIVPLKIENFKNHYTYSHKTPEEGFFVDYKDVVKLDVSNVQLDERDQSLQNILKNYQSTFEHPLCRICSTEVIKNFELKIEQLDLRADHINLLSNSLKSIKISEEKTCDYSKRVLLEQVDLLLSEMEAAKSYNKQLKIDLEKENILLEKCKKDYNHHSLELERANNIVKDLITELHQIRIQTKLSKKLSRQLITSGVLAMNFDIGICDGIGTISGFRLGKRQNDDITWLEVNTALGIALFAMKTVSHLLNFGFNQYQLFPLWNYSYIVNTNSKLKLRLFYESGILGFWNKKFDEALVAFLECLDTCRVNIESKNSQLSLPFQIVNDGIKVPGTDHIYSIKLGNNNYDDWITALKMVLSNLKQILVWLSVVTGDYKDL